MINHHSDDLSTSDEFIAFEASNKYLEKGGVIAYPTEAVFGLGCLPLIQDSVYRILQLKHRAIEKGLILVASSIEQLEDYVHFEKLNYDRSNT